MFEEVINNVLVFILSVGFLVIIGGVFALLTYMLIGRLPEGNTLTVSAGDNSNLAGIPFYIRRGRLTHETTYLETLSTLTLVARKVTLNAENQPGKAAIEYVGTKTISRSPDILPSLVELRLQLAEAQAASNPETQQALWQSLKNRFEALTTYTGQLPSSGLQLESNRIKDTSFVDYENTLYLNQRQPLIGSSDLDFTLAADGTLSKVAAKIEDNTFDKLIGFAQPEVPKSKPQAESPTDSKVQEEISSLDEGSGFVYEFSLTEEKQYARHIFFADYPFTSSARAFRQPIPPDSNDCWYRREVMDEPGKQPEEPAAAATDGKDEKGE